MRDAQARREAERINRAQSRLMELCWDGDGGDAAPFALSFEGPDLVRLQMLAFAESIVGERREDVDMIRNGIAKLHALAETPGTDHSLYNIARSHFAIWTIEHNRLGFADALLEARKELFTARELYEQVAADSDQPESLRLRAATDLGNSLDNHGRHIEALIAYDRALALDPQFGMALGNRGMTLLDRAIRMPDFSDPVICEAVAALDSALAHPESISQAGDPHAIQIFRKYRSRIKGTPTHDHDTVALAEPHLEWCRAHDLLLHPSPRCITPKTKVLDALRFGGLTVGIDDASQARVLTLQDTLNALLQDYLAARYLAWQTLETGSELRHAVAPFNDHAAFTDTLTYARWGTATGLALMALAAATNLLDKVAGATHLYLGSTRQVYFFQFWLRRRRAGQPERLDEVIATELAAGNRGLRALCDLSCELERPGPVKAIRDQRHAATHRAIAVHEVIAPAERIPDDWVERITTAELQDGVLDQLRRSKAALTYLMDVIIDREKRLRPDEDLPSMPHWPAVPENPDLD